MGVKGKASKSLTANLRKRKSVSADTDFDKMEGGEVVPQTKELALSLPPPNISPPNMLASSSQHETETATTRPKRAKTAASTPAAVKTLTALDGPSMPKNPAQSVDLSQLKSLSLKYYVCDKSNVANVYTALERLAHCLENLRLEVIPKDDETYHVKVGKIPALPCLRSLEFSGNNPPDSELLPDLAVQFMSAAGDTLQTCKLVFTEMILLQFVLTLSVMDDDITWTNWAILDDNFSSTIRWPKFERLEVEFEKWHSVHTTISLFSKHLPKLTEQGKVKMSLTGPPRPPNTEYNFD